jgi:hypothetical protein
LALVETPPVSVAATDGSWSFDVDKAFQRQEGSAWDLVVRVKATNDTGPSVAHDHQFYELIVDGVQFDPWCFSLLYGKNPLESGSSSIGTVGFLVPADPTTSHVELAVHIGGPRSTSSCVHDGYRDFPRSTCYLAGHSVSTASSSRRSPHSYPAI